MNAVVTYYLYIMYECSCHMQTSKIHKNDFLLSLQIKIFIFCHHIKVPLHLRANWEGFYLEILMIAGLAAYALNFFAGRSKNSKLATAW